MEEIKESLDNLKTNYRKAFLQCSELIEQNIEKLRTECSGKIFDKFEPMSSGQLWQKKVLDYLENKLSKEILEKWTEILNERKDFSCKCCGTCCRLACSEFSYEQLKEKAKNGDKFATQFVSVFIPYNSKEEAQKIYPEYIKLLEENKDEKVYFYHCPKLTDKNLCSDYKNRPQICRDFPDNPLVLLPKSCGYKTWKNQVQPTALKLHALLQIISYYKENIPL